MEVTPIPTAIPPINAREITVINPSFELVVYDEGSDGSELLLAYRINRQLYRLNNLSHLRFFDANEVRVIPWPVPLTFYSQPILIQGHYTFGVYQTRDGRLDAIIPMNVGDSIRLHIPMSVPSLDTDEHLIPMSGLPEFNQTILENILDAVVEEHPLNHYPHLLERPERPRISSEGIMYVNPIFELVSHDRVDWSPHNPQYSYRIDGNFYRLDSLMRIYRIDSLMRINQPNNVVAIPWPNPLVIYSRIRVLIGQRSVGVYQTREGRLCEIIPIEHSDPIMDMMYPTIPELVDGVVRASPVEFQAFDIDINDILYRFSVEHLPLNTAPDLIEQINSQRVAPVPQEQVDRMIAEARMGAGIVEDRIDLSPSMVDDFSANIPPGQNHVIISNEVPQLTRRAQDPIPAFDLTTLLSRPVEPPVPLSYHDGSSIPKTPSVSELTLEALVRQLYNLPVELPSSLPVPGVGIHGQVIPYKRAVKLLEKGQISKHSIDPLLQVWAGPPGTENRIITLNCTNGSTYLVKAQYDHESNQIFPPS